MKHRVLAALLAAAMACTMSAPAVSAADITILSSAAETPKARASYDTQSVYNAMLALKPKYPDGMKWTNDNYYAWKGGIYQGGFGCAGFAFLLSDAAFGTLPARMSSIFDPSSVRVGDILRYSSHSVIVLEVNASSFTVAEGNINNSIMWGRKITFSEMSGTFENHITRYPESSDSVSATLGDIDRSGKVDASDAAVLLTACAAFGATGASGLSAEQEKDMDVDSDNDFDAADAAAILTYAAYTGSGGMMGFGEFMKNR